ncbi:hypothetical protein AB2B41_11865 [Marimonas sp. MJW-29]|uniref:Uncharacterized protein n=1 Tax=Sulfitobacter sediminis TaxID=3234186 RepID=A0ABV3RMU6_9RHOB
MTDASLNVGSASTSGQGEDDREPSIEDVNTFLQAFVAQAAAPITHNLDDIFEAAAKSPAEADWESLKIILTLNTVAPRDKKKIRELTKGMLKNDDGRRLLEADPDLAGLFLAAGDPTDDDYQEFLGSLGTTRTDAVANAILNLAERDSRDPRDPELFEFLSEAIPVSTWNDTNMALGSKPRGLGARVCAQLFDKKGYDEICALIELGVDTTRPALSDKSEAGAYSGFVRPLQHILQEYLPDTAKLDTDEEDDLSAVRKARAEGVKKIFERLEAEDAAVTLTSWQDIKDSELLEAFQENPGTIWGFESMRGPYVLAAHQTDEGVRPVRMMELWEAIEPALTPENYALLLEKPKKTIRKLVKEGVETIEANWTKTEKQFKDKYDPVRRDKDAYLDRFRADATAMLTELAQQIPEGTFVRKHDDAHGQFGDQDIMLSQIAGIDPGKFMGGIACKAGLWLAKNQGTPVYYCLDGINMDDVVNYKRVKNQAIAEFLAQGGATLGDPHSEVITMCEVREILDNWDDLKDTVKFVVKGEILSGDDLDRDVAGWKRRMAAADNAAGRMPAPPRTTFDSELRAIDPALPGKLDDVASRQGQDTADKDARDIVRQSGYLVKFAHTHPGYVVKYLMSKCEILGAYGLISGGLIAVAADVGRMAVMDPPAARNEINAKVKDVADQLKHCAKPFQQPLAQALVRHPMLLRSNRLKVLKKIAK